MTVRTDIHRPSAPEFDPEKYNCLGVWDMNPEFPDPWAAQNRIRIINDLIGAGYRSGPGGSHQCGHCGAHIRYAALMVRDDVKEWIYVGETCLEGRFEALTADEFRSLREQARLNRDRITKAEKIGALIDAHPALAWAWYPEVLSDGFVADVAYKIRTYVDPSERQIAAFEKALVRDTERAAREAAREIERLAKVTAGVQVPAGRVVVEGVIAWEGWREDSYSGDMVHKMIVESGEGWKVWVTVPAAIERREVSWDAENGSQYEGGVEAGNRVRFTATITPKDGDPTFGYAKRPSKAAVL